MRILKDLMPAISFLCFCGIYFATTDNDNFVLLVYFSVASSVFMGISLWSIITSRKKPEAFNNLVVKYQTLYMIVVMVIYVVLWSLLKFVF